MAADLRVKKNVGKPWSACPNCSRDLSLARIERKVPYECPFCGVELDHIWWQRTTIWILGLILSFTIPAAFGLVGVTLLFVGFLCLWPAVLAAHILALNTVPPKYLWYVQRRATITTLFTK
jgi:hypothetical protein